MDSRIADDKYHVRRTWAKSKEDNHSCDHSYYRYSAKKQIVKTINESEMELTPLQISKITSIKHATVRPYLRILLKEGDICQPYPGAYCNKSTHTVRFVPLKVHNLVLSVSAPFLDFHDEFVELCGAVKLRVIYGVERGRITGNISCDSGMDKDTVFFAVNRFFDIIKQRTGRQIETVIVKTAEFNRDYAGIRLDGNLHCLTRRGLFGALERIYQKEPSVVRHEFKVSDSMGLDQFLALIQGGASSYNLQQALFMIIQKFDRLIEATKFQNRFLKEVFERLKKEGSP